MSALPEWLRPLADRAAAPDVAARVRFRVPPMPQGETRDAAVLVLFGERRPGHGDVLLIERAHQLRAHAGQPAFPGGALDPEDDGPVGAALREAAEETGVRVGGVEVFAVLPELHLPVSSYLVTPVLAWWREPSAVAPVDPAEVAAVHRVPLADLVDPANRLRIRYPSGWVGPAFRVAGMTVWGFTGGLLDRILALGGWERPWDRAIVEDLDQLGLSGSATPAPGTGSGTP
ncbi:MAG TPA: CoA pyrophosphatase [Actinomycetes bacterium]|nr:CoA pyrophosphatase [Actinomycetes bacterium]